MWLTQPLVGSSISHNLLSLLTALLQLLHPGCARPARRQSASLLDVDTRQSDFLVSDKGPTSLVKLLPLGVARPGKGEQDYRLVHLFDVGRVGDQLH